MKGFTTIQNDVKFMMLPKIDSPEGEKVFKTSVEY